MTIQRSLALAAFLGLMTPPVVAQSIHYNRAQTSTLTVNGVGGPNGTMVTVTTGSTVNLALDNPDEANQQYGLFGALDNNAAMTGWFLAASMGVDPFPLLTGLDTMDVEMAVGGTISPVSLGSPQIRLDSNGDARLQLVVPPSFATPATLYLQAVVRGTSGAFEASNAFQIDIVSPDESARLLVSTGPATTDVTFGVLEFSMAAPGTATYTASAVTSVDVGEIGLTQIAEFHPHDYSVGDSLVDRPRDVTSFTGERPALNPDNHEFPRIALPASGGVPERELLRCYDPAVGVAGEGFFLLVNKGINPNTPLDFVRLTGLEDSGGALQNSWDPVVGVSRDGDRMAAVFHDTGTGMDQIFLFATDGTTPFGGADSVDITPTAVNTIAASSVSLTDNTVFFVADDGIDADMDTFSEQLYYAPTNMSAPTSAAVAVPANGPQGSGSDPDIFPAIIVAQNGSRIVFLAGDNTGMVPEEHITEGDWYTVTDADPTTATNITQLPVLQNDTPAARFFVPGSGYNGVSGFASLSPDGSALAFVANHDHQIDASDDDEVYGILTNGGSLLNVLLNSTPTINSNFVSTANPSLDHAQDLSMLDANNLFFFYGDDDGGTKQMDLFHYDLTTKVVTNLTLTGDPVPVVNAGTIYPEGYFRSPSNRYLYFVRGFDAGVSTDRANLVGVDSVSLTTFNVTGSEFGGSPQFNTTNLLGYGDNFAWHLVRGSGAFSSTVYFSTGLDGVTTGQNVFVFDANFPFAALLATNQGLSGIEIESLTPYANDLGASWAWTNGSSDQADVEFLDLNFNIVDNLTESGLGMALSLASITFVPGGVDLGGGTISPGLVYGLGSNAPDNPTDASFFYVSLEGPTLDFTVDPIAAVGLGTGVVQVYHAAIE